MEPERAYFERKHREIGLISGCLSRPARHSRSRSIEAVIELKLRFAAQLKAEHAVRAWHHTETSGQTGSVLRVGAFSFHYRYQRADLAVNGPLPYRDDGLAGAKFEQVTYASSGMAGISA